MKNSRSHIPRELEIRRLLADYQVPVIEDLKAGGAEVRRTSKAKNAIKQIVTPFSTPQGCRTDTSGPSRASR